MLWFDSANTVFIVAVVIFIVKVAFIFAISTRLSSEESLFYEIAILLFIYFYAIMSEISTSSVTAHPACLY